MRGIVKKKKKKISYLVLEGSEWLEGGVFLYGGKGDKFLFFFIFSKSVILSKTFFTGTLCLVFYVFFCLSKKKKL